MRRKRQADKPDAHLYHAMSTATGTVNSMSRVPRLISEGRVGEAWAIAMAAIGDTEAIAWHLWRAQGKTDRPPLMPARRMRRRVRVWRLGPNGKALQTCDVAHSGAQIGGW